MRSRPKVKLFLSPGVVSPGQTLRAEAVLTSKSETPVDFVAIRLRGRTRAGVGSGKSRRVHDGTFFEREWRSKSMTMAPGEHRFETELELPEAMPPTYVGPDASISYVVTVHVSIPWWPDREQDFVVPVAFAPATPLEPLPKVFVTSREGPRGKDPFMELSLDATQISLGDVVSGSISVQNLRGKRIRGVDLSFIEVETLSLPSQDVREGQRFTLRVLDGAPAEGAAIPFRVSMPENATPTFGRLELGRMWIHDAQVGTSAVQIGSVWARGGLHLGTTVIVAIDPPLDTPPTGIEDPALSSAARETWRELQARAKSIQVEASGVSVELEGKLSDPQAAMPTVELAVSLRRALGGMMGAGPFR